MPFEDEEREKGTVEVMEKETLKKVIKSQRKRRTTKPKEKVQKKEQILDFLVNLHLEYLRTYVQEYLTSFSIRVLIYSHSF